MTRFRTARALVALAAAATIPAVPAAARSPDAPAIDYHRLLRPAATADDLEQPLVVHADLHTGEVFVADRRTGEVTIFDDAGLHRYTIRGGRVFSTPLDLAVWPNGDILLLAYADGRRQLLRMDFDGKHPRPVTLSGLPAAAADLEPVSVALSADGSRIYLLDQGRRGLWILDERGRFLESVDLAAGLSEEDRLELLLTHVDVYGDTVLVPLPRQGTVKLLGLDGRERSAVGLWGTSPCQTAFPVAAALDREGRVVVLDKQRTLFMLWDPRTNTCLGEYSGIGSRAGRLYQPSDLALDGDGRVYVAQGFEGRVQSFGGAAPAAGSGSAAINER